jgi:membrane protein implicated in regulation of membrane protease activity
MEAINSFGLVNQIYLLCAVVGGSVFVIKTLLMVIGGQADVHDLDVHGDVHLDTDVSFHLLTIQGIIGFVMMFGLVGLFLSVGLHFPALLSLPGAIAAGFAAMWATARMMTWMKGLQSSGNIEEKNLIGQEGEVYLTIPAGGVGKVHVTVQNRLMEYDAEANDDKEIKTGEQIRVVFMKGNNLIVEKI